MDAHPALDLNTRKSLDDICWLEDLPRIQGEKYWMVQTFPRTHETVTISNVMCAKAGRHIMSNEGGMI